MTALPTGIVTFLFTDIEGSSRLWERDRPAMQRAVACHDALLAEARARSAEQGGAKVRLAGEAHHQAGSWPRPRRVVFKAEALAQGPNTRFVVTSRPDRTLPPSSLCWAAAETTASRGAVGNRASAPPCPSLGTGQVLRPKGDDRGSRPR